MTYSVSRKLLIVLASLHGVSAFATDLPDPSSEWRGLMPETIRQAIPRERTGTDVELVPMRLLYTFSPRMFFEFSRTLRKSRPGDEPAAIMLSNGIYGLADVARLLDDPATFKQIGDRLFISYRPIFVAPSASLVIDRQELRLSRPDVASLIYRGNVIVSDATVTTWDEKLGNYGPRAALAKNKLLDRGSQPARPFLLGLRGSRSYFSASHFRGLGYNGPGAYGISLVARNKDPELVNAGLRNIVLSLPKPIGMLIGNTISHCFFGFYTKRSGPVVLLGNVFHDNVVYNVDPHDYSDHLVIARNIAYGATYKHGIIISRGVNQAQIVENLVFANAGSGIMVDRQSEQTTIQGNIVFANGGDGVAVLESDQNTLNDNLIFGNHRDGIHIRNSSAVQLRNNFIDHNGNDGIEVSTSDLSRTQDRDFELDLFHESGSARIIDNAIHRNLSSAVAGKGNVEIVIRGNDFDRSGAQFFSGDLKADAARILRENRAQGYRYRPITDGESE